MTDLSSCSNREKWEGAFLYLREAHKCAAVDKVTAPVRSVLIRPQSYFHAEHQPFIQSILKDIETDLSIFYTSSQLSAFLAKNSSDIHFCGHSRSHHHWLTNIQLNKNTVFVLSVRKSTNNEQRFNLETAFHQYFHLVSVQERLSHLWLRF